MQTAAIDALLPPPQRAPREVPPSDDREFRDSLDAASRRDEAARERDRNSEPERTRPADERMPDSADKAASRPAADDETGAPREASRGTSKAAGSSERAEQTTTEKTGEAQPPTTEPGANGQAAAPVVPHVLAAATQPEGPQAAATATTPPAGDASAEAATTDPALLRPGPRPETAAAGAAARQGEELPRVERRDRQLERLIAEAPQAVVKAKAQTAAATDGQGGEAAKAPIRSVLQLGQGGEAGGRAATPAPAPVVEGSLGQTGLGLDSHARAGLEGTHGSAHGSQSSNAADIAAAARSVARASAPVTAPGQQVALHIARMAQDGQSRFSLRMDPPELGRVDVKMEVAADGRVTAVVAADRQETLDLLMRDQRALEKALQDAGLQTDSGSLSFSLNEQEQAHDDGPDGAAGASPGDRTGDDESAGAAPKVRTASDRALDIRV